MISAHLVELIQNHAPQLTAETVADLATNPLTPSFRQVPKLDLEGRIFNVYNHLGDWIAAGHGFAEAEFEEWGRRRFDQGIPLRRKGHVDEIAAMVRLLAGPEGGYVTGQTIHVNGGTFLT